MALTHSSALRPTKHQHSGRGGGERERKVPPLALANNMELWKAGGVCACVFALRVCVRYYMCLTYAPPVCIGVEAEF